MLTVVVDVEVAALVKVPEELPAAMLKVPSTAPAEQSASASKRRRPDRADCDARFFFMMT